MIINKTKRTAAIYNRGHEVVKVYDHGKLAWQKSTSIPDYLCFTALDDNMQFTFTKYINLPNTTIPSISYSLDGGDTWTKVAMSGSGNEDIITTPAVNAGGKVLWKAEAGRFAISPTGYSTFTANGRFNVSGNIMSLLYGDNYGDKTDTRAYTYTFGSLFRDSTNLIDASQLKLPTGHLNAGDLLGLFRGCTSLVHGAPLYAPNISDSCCYWMYYGCTSMTEMPTIAATSMLKDNGDPCNYGLYYAFYNCSNMEGEVKLNIVGDVGQQVLDACFSYCSKITSVDLAFNGALGKMALRGAFVGCTLLSHVKCLATSFYDDGTAANGSLYNWMNNVSNTGVFVQASGVTWPRGKSGIPTGWLAYDEGEEIPNDYTPCDYIYNSSTGGGGVDLGFKFRILDYSVEAKFKQDDISNGMVIGTYTNNSGTIWFYNYSVAGSFRINACYSGGWKYNVNGFMPLDTDTHIIRYVGDADGCYQISDGKQSGIHDISTWAAEESTDRLFIFGRSQSQNTYKGRIYYLKVWNTATEEVICNLIPCSRNSDGAAGFWDTAQKKFFTSTYWTAHFDNE